MTARKTVTDELSMFSEGTGLDDTMDDDTMEDDDTMDDDSDVEIVYEKPRFCDAATQTEVADGNDVELQRKLKFAEETAEKLKKELYEIRKNNEEKNVNEEAKREYGIEKTLAVGEVKYHQWASAAQYDGANVPADTQSPPKSIDGDCKHHSEGPDEGDSEETPSMSPSN